MSTSYLHSDLPGSVLSSSRLLFLRSTSPGCMATVADDDTTPGAVVPADNGGTCAEAIPVVAAWIFLPVVVVGDTVVTDTAVVAVETSG